LAVDLAAARETRGVRLLAEITAARIESPAAEANRRLQRARREAEVHGLALVALEARLAAAEIAGPPALGALALDAERQGFGLAASRARRLQDRRASPR
jgi:hypothetical protein